MHSLAQNPARVYPLKSNFRPTRGELQGVTL